MATDNSLHMTTAQFRRCGKRLVDWIADYYDRIEQYPVLSTVSPGDIRSSLPDSAPETGEPFEALLKDFETHVMPGITHWQSPNFYAYFPANTSGPSILGELLTAGLGVQGMLWSTSPACTELEAHVLDWLVDMLQLPRSFRSSDKGGGVIQDSASSAALCAVLAGRERATGCQSNQNGCDGKLVAYASTQTHSSVEKAIKIAGIGQDRLRKISVDDQFAMEPGALATQMDADRKSGLNPCFVCATVGTTSSNAVDPVEAIGKICRKRGVWLHVDGAMAGTAAICPEYRFIHDGLELADSYCFNPHKWMFTNFDCDCFYVNDRQALTMALSILPEYLRNEASASGQVIDYRDWQIPLGRRFRSLKLWFVIRHYGVDGLRYHIRRHIALARQFADWVDDDHRFMRASPAPLNLVCFYHTGGNAFNEALMNRLNQSGRLFLSHTMLQDRFVLRFCVGQTQTELRHVSAAWRLICKTADELSAEENR